MELMVGRTIRAVGVAVGASLAGQRRIARVERSHRHSVALQPAPSEATATILGAGRPSASLIRLSACASVKRPVVFVMVTSASKIVAASTLSRDFPAAAVEQAVDL